MELITNPKKNQKNVMLLLPEEKILLRKRVLIETVIDQLKNISQVKHTRHRSCWNFLVNVIAGLIAYSWREKKPSLRYVVNELLLAV